MDISRRWFLGGALGVAAASVLPLGAGYDAVLYADGIHDDTLGLQALLDGKAVYVKNDNAIVMATDGQIDITGGRYKVSKTLHLNKRRSMKIKNAHLDFSNLPDGDPWFYNTAAAQ